MLSKLGEGDLVLLGARPRQGKTTFGLGIAAAAARSGRRSFFFTLESNAADVAGRLRALGVDRGAIDATFVLDMDDAISAGHVIDGVGAADRRSVVVIDYLQLLDQRRENRALDEQLRQLGAFAKARGIVVILLSQIDRRFDVSGKAMPDLGDVRMPNRLDLGVFTKSCFLHGGAMAIGSAG